MAQKYCQKEYVAGQPLTEMEAVEYTGTNLDEIMEFAPEAKVDSETGKLILRGVEVVPTSWIIRTSFGGILSNMAMPATPDFPNHHLPIDAFTR